MSGALVLAEGKGGRLERITRELLALGKRELGTAAAVATDPTLAGPLYAAGADTVYLPADAAGFTDYRTLTYTRLMAEAVRQAQPEAVLLPAVYRSGRDLGPRLAARLEAPIVTEVTGLVKDGAALKATRMLYAEKALATFTARKLPAVYTCSPGACEPLADDTGRTGMPVPLTVPLDSKDLESTVEVISTPASSEGSLAEAKVVVAVGRGMNGDFTLARELAKELGGVIGASRAVTDAGQLPHDRQIGQTGVTVQPNVYIAIAISGAIQHVAGMKGAKYVIAVNKDKDAPIFKVANAGIIADYKEAVPKLLEAVRALQAKA